MRVGTNFDRKGPRRRGKKRLKALDETNPSVSVPMAAGHGSGGRRWRKVERSALSIAAKLVENGHHQQTLWAILDGDAVMSLFISGK